MKQVTPGQLVRYHPIIGEDHDGKVYTVREMGNIPSARRPVAWLFEKRGCVMLEALSPCEELLRVQLTPEKR